MASAGIQDPTTSVTLVQESGMLCLAKSLVSRLPGKALALATAAEATMVAMRKFRVDIVGYVFMGMMLVIILEY